MAASFFREKQYRPSLKMSIWKVVCFIIVWQGAIKAMFPDVVSNSSAVCLNEIVVW